MTVEAPPGTRLERGAEGGSCFRGVESTFERTLPLAGRLGAEPAAS